jgi:hypothetical protein
MVFDQTMFQKKMHSVNKSFGEKIFDEKFKTFILTLISHNHVWVIKYKFPFQQNFSFHCLRSNSHDGVICEISDFIQLG